MGFANTIMIICGIIVSIIGIVTWINPNFERLINAPGGPRLKGTIALVVGIIILIIGLIIEMP
jgi:hypothetical protein